MASKTEFMNSPLAGDENPEDFLPHIRSRKGLIRHWISKPAVRVFIALVVITALSFFPAALSGSKDLGKIDADYLSGDSVFMLGDIFNFDWKDAKKVSVAWSLYGFGKYQMDEGSNPYGYPLLDRAADIYMNNASQPIFSYDPALIPTTATSGKMLAQSLSTFNTEHYTQFCTPQYYAPNDCYSFSAFVFIIEKATNKSIPVSFEITNSGPGDFSAKSNGEPSRSNFTYEDGGRKTTEELDSYAISPVITRSGRARALTYFMFAINWLLTLSSLITTAFVFNRKGTVKDSVALLPITVILTIPTIRGLYAGSPPFGIFLDVVGFFPQMMSVAMCIIVVISGFGLQYMRGRGGNGKGEEA